MTTEVAAVEQSLRLLHEPGSVFELRIPNTGRAGTVSGYFDDPAKAAAAIAKWDGKAPGVYVTINPVKTELLARAANRLRERARDTTSDPDVVRRRWLLIDVDIQRPAGISATGDEVRVAGECVRHVKRYLEDERGWPAGMVVFSGNGGHLLYRIDLPNDTESRDLLKRVLAALAARFDDTTAAGVKIDTTVFNAARIAKVPGSMACKGDDLPERPHRRSRVLSVPDAWAVVSAPVLLAEDGAAPRARTSSGNGEFDLEAFLADNHLEVRKHKQEGGGDVWELAVCPFNADHDHGEAFVRRDADGTISAGCQHQTCFSSWEELRERYEPGYRQRQTTGVGTYEPAAAPAAGPAEGDPLVHEAAHAEVLMDVWRDEYRWAHHEGTWRHWTGRVWKAAAEPVVVAAAQKVLRRHYGRLLAEMQTIADDKRLHTLHGEACRYASVLGGLRFLSGEAGFHTAVEEWDADPYLLNCADGLLDLRTQTLGPHDAAALCTKIARWSFGGDESSGACQRHLQRCLPDADVRRQVQRDLGRALVGADLEESLPIWYGIGRNGKTTTARTVRHGLGEYGKKAAEGLLMARRNEQHPTEMAALSGARFVVSEEVEQGKRLNESRVKELTGGEPPQARFMHCDFFHLEQTFTIFLLVNHRPEIAGTDKGIWGRVRLVPWTVSIPFAEQRPMDEMVAELSADGAWMLRWMVAGFADWQAEPHWIAAEVLLATEEYRCEQDQLAGFLADACEEKPFATVVVTELHAAYASWSETAGEVVLGKIALGKAMRSRGFTQKKATGGTRVWLGIRLSGEKWQACSLSSRDDFSIAQPAELPLVATDDELAP